MSRNSSSKRKGSVNEITDKPGEYSRPDDISLQAAQLAHDLNNVLATISGYAEMIRDDLPSGSPLRNDTNRIMSGVIRARLLTEEILNLGKYTVQVKKETDVAALLRESIDFLVSIQPENILIETDVPDIRAFVSCVPGKLFRVFMNIIKNAIQAMEKTGGKLTAGLFLSSPEQVVIYFRDTGPGIDRSVIEKIYDPYFTTRNTSGGRGLGLSVVKDIVSEMNGIINVVSNPGEGTEFRLLLPVTT